MRAPVHGNDLGRSSAPASSYDFSAWLGRCEEQEDVVTAAPLAGLAATLDHAKPPWRDGETPPLAHWLYFLPRAPLHELAEDGHPARGGFLPPVPLPRRMWAGGSITFAAPLHVGESTRRRSTIADIQHKKGRSGNLVFVKVVHEIFGGSGLALREEQDIVYREAPQATRSEATRDMTRGEHSRVRLPPTEKEAPIAEKPTWMRTVRPDSVLLFRFSALTFNGHRIHYDRDYCREREGYPGLVVHGPLIATLLMDLFLRNEPGARPRTFRFRSERPAFDTGSLTLWGIPGGATTSLWAENAGGERVMSAELDA
jgi:3-methylfumaryl-CoA hydratase